jgi:hypothetical protein
LSIIAFTRAETEGAKFTPDNIWRDAVRRFAVRLQAYVEGVRRWMLRRHGRGELTMPEGVRERHAKLLSPCYRVEEDGCMARSAALDALLLTVAREEQVERDKARARLLHKRKKHR